MTTADGGDESALERQLLSAMLDGAAESIDAPHVVLTHSRSTGLTYVCGPFPSSLAALTAADQEASLEAESADLVFRVAQIHAPATGPD